MKCAYLWNLITEDEFLTGKAMLDVNSRVITHTVKVNVQKKPHVILVGTSAQNGPVYASIPYQNLFLYLNFIPALINIDNINLTFSLF
jgi:hypothetical protein